MTDELQAAHACAVFYDGLISSRQQAADLSHANETMLLCPLGWLQAWKIDARQTDAACLLCDWNQHAGVPQILSGLRVG